MFLTHQMSKQTNNSSFDIISVRTVEVESFRGKLGHLPSPGFTDGETEACLTRVLMSKG